MPCYEGKPNPASKDLSKKPTPTPIQTTSGDSSDISSTSDDSLLGTDHSTNFQYPVFAAEDVPLPDSEDGIVLHLHDISYMREAVKQAENEEENASSIESSDAAVPVGENFAEAGTSSSSSFRVPPTVSLMNLLENDSGNGSTSSLNVRAAAAASSAADNGDIYIPRPNSN